MEKNIKKLILQELPGLYIADKKAGEKLDDNGSNVNHYDRISNLTMELIDNFDKYEDKLKQLKQHRENNEVSEYCTLSYILVTEILINIGYMVEILDNGVVVL